jgi:ABC-type multidrug transport system fused ATPase/permease subunit
MMQTLSTASSFRALWFVLELEQRKAAILLFSMMIIGTLLELIGIGLVFPVMALIANEEPTARYPLLSAGIMLMGNPSRTMLVVISMLALLGVYAFRTGFLALLAWQQSRFVYRLQARLAQRLFNGYLWQPYSFHLKRNSAQLIRNTISQVGTLVGAVQQGLMLLTELMVLVTFSLCLLLVEPLGVSLIVGTLGGLAWGFNLLTRKRIQRWGESLQKHESKRVQHLQEGLGGAKDIKLLGREREFIADFELHNYKSAQMMEMHTTLVALPRLWLEFLAVGGLVSLVLIMVWQGKTVNALLPTLGVFGAAAFRLMPSVNRIIGGIQNTRFAFTAIENLTQELRLLTQQQPVRSKQTFTFKKEMVISGVSFRYEGADKDALSRIEIRIERGSAVGLIGGSGAGKSTLIDIIVGLLQPTGGRVYVDGVDILHNLRGWQDKIGYVPQHIYLTDDTLRRNVAFGIADSAIDDAAVTSAVSAAQLDEFVASLPQGLQTVVGERGVRFSGGQRQRIGIARALYHNPELLVLDEATSALDQETESAVMQAIGQLKGSRTIVVVAHRLSTVQQCDWVYRLCDSIVVQDGTASDVLGSQLSFEKNEESSNNLSKGYEAK